MAVPFSRNPEALANKVYGGRLGNTAPGDGWRYRGRGLIQVTGLDNYHLVEKVSGLRVVSNPDLLKQPPARRSVPALTVEAVIEERDSSDR